MIRPPSTMARHFMQIFLTAIAVTLVGAQWSGCNVPNVDNRIERGSTTPVCVVVSQGGNWASGVTYTRYLWTPTADAFSRYTLANSYRDLVINESPDYTPAVSVHTESQFGLSFIRTWYDSNRQRIYPYLNAIITAKDGVVVGVTWDDACIFCSASRCVENTYFFNGTGAVGSSTGGCYFTREQCDVISAAGGDQCDITVYAVWTGTDARGRVLDSFNSRFSAFPSSNVVQALKDSLSDLQTGVENAAEKVSNATLGG